MRTKILLLAIAVCCLSSCYYDNEDELHPALTIPDNRDTSVVINSCDTTVTISYVGDIKPIMNSSCGANDNNCHATGNTSSGIVLDNYADIKDLVIDGSFLASIVHDPGYNPMPQGGGKLDDCSINKIKCWINHAYPNN